MLTGTCHCGAAHWTLEGDPGRATSCNCTLCRRYGALWAYDYEDERIRVAGPTVAYRRADLAHPMVEVRFCPTCGAIVYGRALQPEADGRRRAAVNLRLAPPDEVADLPLRRLDGLETFKPMADDGRRVRDLWF